MEEKHAEIAHRVEQERASRDQAMANERQARAELQTALQTEEVSMHLFGHSFSSKCVRPIRFVKVTVRLPKFLLLSRNRLLEWTF